MGKPGGMSGLGKQVAEETNEALREQELALLAKTSDAWERFRPMIADQETYDALNATVKAWTAHNESLAQLRGRIEALGENGVAVARKVLALIKAA